MRAQAQTAHAAATARAGSFISTPEAAPVDIAGVAVVIEAEFASVGVEPPIVIELCEATLITGDEVAIEAGELLILPTMLLMLAPPPPPSLFGCTTPP